VAAASSEFFTAGRIGIPFDRFLDTTNPAVSLSGGAGLRTPILAFEFDFG
jgi:hypothetical protein